MANETKKVPVWQPTKKQRKWIDAKVKSNKKNGVSGGMGQVMRNLVNEEMEREN